MGWPRVWESGSAMRSLLVLSILLLSAPALAGEALWTALKSKHHFVLVRHALAPGYGDPDGFQVKDCQTQRNLNETGRQQSRRIGDLFKSHGIAKALVYSSQWCRCLETASLMGIGEVSELPPLNSLFLRFERKQIQTEQIADWMERRALSMPTVLVTHQVNITALTGYFPASGELVFVRKDPSGALAVIGTIDTL